MRRQGPRRLEVMFSSEDALQPASPIGVICISTLVGMLAWYLGTLLSEKW